MTAETEHKMLTFNTDSWEWSIDRTHYALSGEEQARALLRKNCRIWSVGNGRTI